jgi:hypothetical protein
VAENGITQIITSPFGHYRVATCDLVNPRLPPIPTAIIWIPFIKIAIEILRANRTTPMVRGCINTSADTAMLSAPTPTRKALDHLEACLCVIPCITLAIPLKSKAIPPNNIKKAAVRIGNDITAKPNATTKTPSPIFVQREDLCRNGAIPVAILSKPTINKVIESIRITVNIAMPGYVNIIIDSIIEIAPRPILQNATS